ncbi:MAG TPA: class I SAM-dependent methyltransferase [Polyangiaceae bacterium]|nr:class I SAM-dependent methyltransferase [Polyangiaceae bacterium]
MTSSDWWRPFFAEPWAKIQAGGYSAERTSAECDLIEGALALPSGASVLDIPCGIGRHSVELARRGYRLTGADFNEDHVSRARDAARVANVSVDFVVGDMRDYTTEARFDGAFCYFGSFGYFDDADDERFARRVAQVLRPGGRFLIEGHIAETLLPMLRERDWYWAGGEDAKLRVLEERALKLETSRIDVTWTIVDDGGAHSSAVSIRLYTYRELRDLLRRAGFASVDVFDGKTGQAFELGARRALVVARAP